MRQQRQLKPYSKKKQCPCGSNSSYGNCCARKKIVYQCDRSGRIYQTIKMSEEVKIILEEQMRDFKRYFGRKPGSNDAVFFQAQAFESSESLHDKMTDIMKEADIDDALIYAHDKCGFLLTPYNQDHVPVTDEKAWEDAIKKVNEIKNGKKKKQDRFSQIVDSIMDEFFAVIF